MWCGIATFAEQEEGLCPLGENSLSLPTRRALAEPHARSLKAARHRGIHLDTLGSNIMSWSGSLLSDLRLTCGKVILAATNVCS
jgi:hypothetical protein